MRRKKLIKNTISSLLFQITTIICGFILPRLILKYYGSETNGLVNSITQFLEIIAFLELGMGAVVQSNLYKPLANNDDKKTSDIITSANKFFRNLARILLVYVVILVILYPLYIRKEFEFLYTGTLIISISISSFSQYYFGIVDRLLLTADQKGYIQYNCQTLTLILNTIACYVLIKLGASIHIVKLTTSLIYLLRPIYLRVYVNRNYNINRKSIYDKEPIQQKWNGVAQHVAAVILDGTDSIILTLFSTLENVSIYSVYSLVLTGVKKLLLSMTNGIQALLGELWAKQELESLRMTFGMVEWGLHTVTVLVFGCTGVLIIPFVKIYTSDVNDTNYIVPLFSVLITIAHGGHCLRLPYNIMILAAGQFKSTQRNYVIAALLNITVSIICVFRFGLIGVAIGTVVAMAYQTIWMAIYNSKNLIKWDIRFFIKQISVDCITIGAGVIISLFVYCEPINYIEWGLFAIKIVFIWLITVAFMNLFFYRKKLIMVINKLIRVVNR